MQKPFVVLVAIVFAGFWVSRSSAAETPAKLFRAGAHAIDITPQQLPVRISGGFLEDVANQVTDRLHARCLVLDDGTKRLAIVVVDNCMMPRELLDEAKEQARRRTGIPTERMLISATHTHSGPAAMGCLGCRTDTNYTRILPGKIAEGIERAVQNLAPARVGWGVVDDPEHTHTRRWIYRSDQVGTDPFGDRTVRANMHPGHRNPNVIGPSGPKDPGLSMLSVQTRDGRPLALLANYSMHYYGATAVSADYYGRFATQMAKLIGGEVGEPPFVGIMSQGTSGDQMWMDYGQSAVNIGLDAYAQAVAKVAFEGYQKIQYQNWVPLAMAETTLSLRRRTPSEQRLAWAKAITDKMTNDLARTIPEVYALEAFFLHREPIRELKLQALRIGELGITAIPNEVYAITGLKLKAWSPLQPTFNIELANGAEGYIPTPEQHKLGGYTTWPARTAALEETAEPKIVETVLGLLERVAGRHAGPAPNRTAHTPAPCSRPSRSLTGASASSTGAKLWTPPGTTMRRFTKTALPSISLARSRRGSPNRAVPIPRLISRAAGLKRPSRNWPTLTPLSFGFGTGFRLRPAASPAICSRAARTALLPAWAII